MPGHWPAVRAALWATVAAAFRVVVFIYGALILSGVMLVAGGILLMALATGPLSFAGADLPRWMQDRTGTIETLLESGQAVWLAVVRLVVVGYVGAHVPVRTAAKSAYPLERIRPWVAAVGGVALVALLFVPMDYEPITAAGMLAAPAVFVVMALRGRSVPRIAQGMRPYTALALLFLLGNVAAIVGMVVMAQSPLDTSAVGLPTSAIGISQDDLSVGFSADNVPERGPVGWSFIGWPESLDMQARLASIQIEVWPATLALGGARVGVSAERVSYASRDPLFPDEWPVTAPKVPETIAVLAVGITPDGRRIVLGSQVLRTPLWHGPLAGYLFGG